MHSRWYSVTVVLLWVAAMGWLITKKVLPTLLVGEPPSYREILQAKRDPSPECWQMLWNGRPLGWAASAQVPIPEDMTEIRSRVHFDELPLDELMPGWLLKALGPMEDFGSQIAVEARNKLVFDPLGRLSRFESFLGTSATNEEIKVRGLITGGRLTISMHLGGVTYDTEVDLPPKILLKNAISPEGRLPGLREGQSWSVEVFSPLRPPNEPMELLRATVEGLEPILWGGQPVDTWLVVYRNDPGAAASRTRRERGRMWVDPKGAVLRQQVEVLGSHLSFVRMTDRQAAELLDEVELWPEEKQ